jgi:hypothetical protein
VAAGHVENAIAVLERQPLHERICVGVSGGIRNSVLPELHDETGEENLPPIRRNRHVDA